MGIFLLLRAKYQCRLRGGKQRKGQECGAQQLSGKYEDKRKNWLWMRESIINVDRKEPQYWYLTPGEKASKVQTECSQEGRWTVFLKLMHLRIQQRWFAGPAFYRQPAYTRIVSAAQLSWMLKSSRVLHVGADQSSTAFFLVIVSTSHLPFRPFNPPL